MKQRITAMLLALALCGSLAACGNAEDTGRAEQQEENQTVDTMKPDAQPETEPEPSKPTAAQASGYVGSSASAMESALGSPSSKTYSPSCMGEGEDGIWTYDGFTVYTYRENGSETVEAVQ